MKIISCMVALLVPSVVATAAEKIVFVSTARYSNKSGIVVMDADGSHRVMLTKDGHEEFQPVLSPDGKQIAFVRDDTLWVMNSDGSGRKQIGRLGKELGGRPSWSPDSKRIIYFVNYADARGSGGFVFGIQTQSDLLVVDADGKNTQSLCKGLTVSLGEVERTSVWSPDGKQVLYSHHDELHAVGSDGKSDRILCAGGKAAWSPDGKKILYLASEKKDDREEYLYVMNIEGEKRKRLSKTTAVCGVWSPDGKRIAYLSCVPAKDRSPLWDLYVCSSDGSDPIRLTEAGYLPTLRWSADGKRIIFNRLYDKARLPICVIDPDGKNEKELTKGCRHDFLANDYRERLSFFVDPITLDLKAAAGQDAEEDAETLQGSWQLVRSEQGALDDTWEVKDQLVIFEKDAFTLKQGDKVLLKGTFKLDITRSPKTIDITITEGGPKGKTMLGIWEIDREGLRWCVAEPGAKDRPTAFATNRGSSDRRSSFEKHKP